MSEPRRRVNPRMVPPDRDPGLHPNPSPERSIVESLGAVVDDARQLLTDFGMRPYRVFSIVVEWSGSDRGRGLPRVVSEQEILPTPEVDFAGLRGQMRSAGKVDTGGATLRELSPRLTEEDIELLFHVQPLPAGQEGFIEIQMDRRDGEARRRRFVVQGAPQRKPEDFEWTVRLASQEGKRERSGRVRRGLLQGQKPRA